MTIIPTCFDYSNLYSLDVNKVKDTGSQVLIAGILNHCVYFQELR